MSLHVDVDPVADAEWAVERAERAVGLTLRDQDIHDARISVALLDDTAMAELNQRWKGRDEPTDVLAFPLHEAGEPPLGDIYLCVDQIVAQAAELGEAREQELERVAIHGTLHVLGWDHPEEGRESSEMWACQERILEQLTAG